MNKNWSRISGFYEQNLNSRRDSILNCPIDLSKEDFAKLDDILGFEQANNISENVVGVFGLPLSVAPNFIINGEPCLVPMVTEEPSVVAGLSKMAKIIAQSGGFKASASKSLMKGQIQCYGFSDIDCFLDRLQKDEKILIERANNLIPTMIKRGGGVLEIRYKPIKKNKANPMVIVEPIVDVKDAMGANIINTVMEFLGSHLEKNYNIKVNLKILSNLSDERLAHAQVSIPIALFESQGSNYHYEEIAQRIFLAQVLAEEDIYRACTHNKGIMNGIDAVAIATGSDFRAIEAGAHAYASKTSGYKPLTKIDLKDGRLEAKISLPIAVGIVGGNSNIHEGVKFSLKLLDKFATSSQGLACVMACVGLAQCLAALLALCTNGIQKGHMRLHRKKNI